MVPKSLLRAPPLRRARVIPTMFMTGAGRSQPDRAASIVDRAIGKVSVANDPSLSQSQAHAEELTLRMAVRFTSQAADICGHCRSAARGQKQTPI
jgi:hypothetical protein